jgi:hypothetical protein
VAVDEDAAAVEAEVVAGQADDALDEMEGGIDGVVEDDDVAAMDGGRREEAGGSICVGGAGLLVDEEEVADEEGRLHRPGGDAEGLCAEGDDEDRDDDEMEEGLERGKGAGFVVESGGWVRTDALRRGAGARDLRLSLTAGLGLELGLGLGLELTRF